MTSSYTTLEVIDAVMCLNLWWAYGMIHAMMTVVMSVSDKPEKKSMSRDKATVKI